MSHSIIFKGLDVLRTEGGQVFLKKTKKYLLRRWGYEDSFRDSNSRYMDFWGANFYNFADLRELIRSPNYRGIYVMGSLCVGWFDKVKQRQHHIAEYLMKQGYLVICGMNPIHPADDTPSIKRINKNLVLVNFYNRAFWSQILQCISLECKTYKFYHIIGTEPGTTLEEIDWLKSLGFTINYEFYDEISKEIFDLLDEKTILRHPEILRDKDIVVVTTADELYKQATRFRKENVLLSVNAATIEDWQFDKFDNFVPDQMKDIIRKNKKIVGFYGSFAAWLDYDYIKFLSLNRPDYEIVMIGYDYEKGKGAFAKSKISELNNVNIIPAQPYKSLKYFSRYFDVAMIPFREYDLTQTVSPVKMFEHMAQRIPVVTTNMYECKKYPEVLVSKSKEEFVQNIDRAIRLKESQEFTEALFKRALQNSWDARGKVIQNFLESKQKKLLEMREKKTKILSIGIPSYNMEQFINRCLDTLLHPAILDLIEILVIDDGSKDKTAELANYYAEIFPETVKVISKTNGGHGSCINSTISNATGKYTKLLDSDDFLDSTELVKHILYLVSTDADMIVTNYNRFDENGRIEPISYSDRLDQTTRYDRSQFCVAMLKDRSFVSYAHMHSVTYRTSVLKGMSTPITENSFYVDQEYITLPLMNINSVVFQPIFLYQYFVGRPGQSVDPEIAKSRSYMNLNVMKNIIGKYGDTLKLNTSFSKYLRNILYHQTTYWLSCTNDTKSIIEVMDWWEKTDIDIYNLIKKNL